VAETKRGRPCTCGHRHDAAGCHICGDRCRGYRPRKLSKTEKRDQERAEGKRPPKAANKSVHATPTAFETNRRRH
jgi:hypothetical protein